MGEFGLRVEDDGGAPVLDRFHDAFGVTGVGIEDEGFGWGGI